MHWFILKTHLNNKKIYVISQIIYVIKTNVVDFKKKCEIFNYYSFKQCLLTDNTSKIPLKYSKKSSESLSSITTETSTIEKMIKNVGPNKSHYLNILSILMLKLFGNSINKPLNLLFKSCLGSG